MSHVPSGDQSDPPVQPRVSGLPNVSHAARCFQELLRRQSTCEGLRRTIRHESDRTVRRRLRWVLRRAQVKERAAIQAYRLALRTAARAILTKHYPDSHPK